MPDYNPNSVWGSKEKKYTYIPPGDQSSYTNTKPAPGGEAPNSNLGGTPGGGSPGNFGSGKSTQPSFFHRHGLIFFTLGIFAAIALAAFIYYLVLPPATPNVVITFSDPGSVVVGKPFPLTVTVSNESKSVLQNANLNISLPNGFSFVGEDPTQRVLVEPVGTLSSQTINPPQTVQVIATANSAITTGSSYTIGAQLTYQTAATAATQFQNNAQTSIAIGTQSALSISYKAPSGIFSGQNFDIAVTYQNNTSDVLQDVQLAMQYPPAYHYVTTDGTTPTGAANNMWDLGELPPNATGTLVITGNIVGPTQAQYPITGTIGATFSGQNYPAAAAPVSFVVTPSPLSLTVSLNNSQTYVAKLGDNLDYTLTYTNNSNITFQSVNISATLVGSMYNFSSLKTTGSFNSQSNTVTWYAANTPALASLAPGQSGSVTLTINSKAAFPIQRINDKNYSLSLTAKAQSPTVPPNTAGTNTTSVTAITNKVGGKVTLTSMGYYRETTSDIINTGPYPPKVEQPTKYTIHWTIANYSTDVNNVTVSAYLQSGSTFTGAATSSGLTSTPLPTYNAGTGLVTWTIPYIPATAGVISPPIQAIFQITNTPAVNEIGQTVPLVGATTLTANDAYTSSTVHVTADPINSQLPNDPSLTGKQGNVTQ